jgi:hypothetical protein
MLNLSLSRLGGPHRHEGSFNLICKLPKANYDGPPTHWSSCTNTKQVLFVVCSVSSHPFTLSSIYIIGDFGLFRDFSTLVEISKWGVV